ncbi:hypothetical protein V3Q90_15100, partial [Flavobacterium oreochromis]
QEDKYKVAGAFKLVHVSDKNVNVGLIALNGKAIPSAEIENLKAIYAKAGVTLTITQQGTVTYLKDKITTGDSELLNYYTADEKEINAQVAQLPNYNKQSYYIIYSDKSSSTGIQGFMPLGGQFGYVFGGTNTSAHELGHGVFALEHPFANEGDKGKTSFLMDYGSGTTLSHIDWAQINNPKLKFYGFQGDSQGEFNGGFALNPKYEYIQVNSSTITGMLKVSSGALQGFVENGKYYTWDGQNYTDNGDVGNVKKINPTKDTDVIYLFYDTDNICGFKKYIETTYGKISKLKSEQDFIKFYTDNKALAKLVGCTPNNKEKWDYKEKTTDNGGNGLTLVNLIKTEKVSKLVLEKLANLLSKTTKNGITKENHVLNGRIILTAENAADNTYQINVKNENGKEYYYIGDKKQEILPNDIYFWLEHNSEGKIRIKKVLTGDSFDTAFAANLQKWDDQLVWEQSTFFEKLTTTAYSTVDGYFTGMYDVLDMLSKGIGKLKIQESVWNCNSTEYNPIYAEVFSYVSITSVINDLVENQIAKSYPELGHKLNEGGQPNQMQFAFFCGMYNGLIDVVKSVPDLAKFIVSVGSSKGRENNSKFLQQIEDTVIEDENGKILYDKGLDFDKILFILWKGISKSFVEGKKCESAEFVGSIVSPIVVMCFGDVAAGEGIISRIGATTFKVLQWCDKIADPFRYVGMSFRFVKTSTNKLVVSIKQGAEEVMRQLDNGLFKVKIIINHTELPRFVEVPETVMAQLADGQTVNVMIDGTEQSVRFMTGKFGGSLADIATQIFGEANETLLKRFIDLGIDNANLERVIKAIGKSTANGKKLADLLEKASFKNDLNKLRGFLSDIEKSTELQDLVKAGKDFSKAWQWLNDLRPNIKRTKAVVEALNDVISNPSMITILGDELDDILKKFMTAHKNSKWGWNKFSFEEHMRMLKVIANTYEGVDGFNKSIRDALNNPNPAVQDGFWHMMKDLENRGIPKDKVKSFDLEFDGDDLPCIKCKFDVELNTNNATDLRYLEYKSYANASKISKPQFLNYITKVENLEQLQYVFNKSKLSLQEAKNGMKEFLKIGDNMKDIYNANQNLFNKIQINPNNYIDSWEKLKAVCENDTMFENLIAKKIVTTN